MVSNDKPGGIMFVSAGDASVRGEIRRDGGFFVTLLDGSEIGTPSGLDPSIDRLTSNIRSALPLVAPAGWQVIVECRCPGEFKVFFTESDVRLEVEDAARAEIWESLRLLPRHSLSDAIEAGAILVKHCIA